MTHIRAPCQPRRIPGNELGLSDDGRRSRLAKLFHGANTNDRQKRTKWYCRRRGSVSEVPLSEQNTGAFYLFVVYCQQGKNMQVLIVFGIIAIIVLAIELSVIAYFAVMFFKQAFKVAQKVEEKEHELDHAIKDTAGFLNHIIGHSINSLVKALDKFLKKRKF
jgi:hypothetical protein